MVLVLDTLLICFMRAAANLFSVKIAYRVSLTFVGEFTV